MNRKTLGWLWRTPGRKKGYIAALTGLQVMQGFTGVLYALLLRNIIDCAVNRNTEGFWHAVILIILLVCFQLLIQAVIRWLNERTRSTLENLFRHRLTENLLRRDYARVCAFHSGEWMNRATSDTVVVTNGYVEILPGLAGTAVRLIAAFVLLFALQPKFALILLPCGIILAGLTSLFRPQLKRLHRSMQEKDGMFRSFLQERINSLMVIKSFAAEQRTLNEADGLMQEHRRARMRKNYCSNFLNTGFAAAMEAVYLFGACYCAYGIMTGTISYGTLAAVAQLVGQIRTPLAHISGFLPAYYSMLASAERLMEAESFPEDDRKGTLSKEAAAELYRNDMAAFGLEDADYTYNPIADTSGETEKTRMPIVLNHFSLEIRKGEYVAFTGHSGCGKSTVLKLLMNMYPLDNGECFIRKTDDTKTPLTAAYRRLFAYVPQGNQLMNGTIREIVAFSDEGKPDDSRIENALQIACADGFVSELEKGINTQLGERGTGLSEGQMQRIAIARALYSDAPVLLLDEATSALDAETEKRLLMNLRNLTDKTVITVTHRAATLEICDRVMEFTNERVVDISTKK